MLERLQRLFKTQRLTKEGLKNAVAKGLISKADYETITGEKYEA